MYFSLRLNIRGVIDCNEWKTEKRHECANMEKVKRLELWWQLYRTSLPVRDLETFRPVDFCSTVYRVVNTELLIVKLISLINFVFPLALPCERRDTKMKTEHYVPHSTLSTLWNLCNPTLPTSLTSSFCSCFASLDPGGLFVIFNTKC